MALVTSSSDPIDILKIDKPEEMEYSFTITNDREKVKFIKVPQTFRNASNFEKNYFVHYLS